MKKLFLTTLVALVIMSLNAGAQLNYSFSVKTDTYQPLTGNTVSVNDTNRWDDEYYEVPLGFNFKFAGYTIDTIYLQEDNSIGIDVNDTTNVFYFTDLDLYDRGLVPGDSVTRSPIRYQLTGSMGSRILKLEIANAGIYDEYDIYSTNNDSVYMQMWFYEGTNVVEFRYGPAHVTKSHYADYYYSTGSPLFGYVKNMDTMGNVEKFYYLDGNYQAPVIDSVTDFFNLTSGGLNEHPANGTVYKFTPIPTNVKNIDNRMDGLSMISNAGVQSVTLNSAFDETLKYVVLSLNGSVTSLSGNITKGENVIDINSLPHGMYVLQVAGTQGVRAFRITRQ